MQVDGADDSPFLSLAPARMAGDALAGQAACLDLGPASSPPPPPPPPALSAAGCSRPAVRPVVLLHYGLRELVGRSEKMRAGRPDVVPSEVVFRKTTRK